MATVNETRGKLIGFAYLKNGWYFGEGVPAKEDAMKIALNLVNHLEEAKFICLDAYPGIDGSVMVSAYDGRDAYDFNVRPSGLITVAHDRGDEDLFYQERMTEDQARQKIREFGKSKCHTSDFSILNHTTVKNTVDLKALHSSTQKTDQESQSYHWNASEAHLTAPALILPIIIQRSQARRSYFGKSRVPSLKTIGT